MKTKQELKQYFENGDIPVQEEFWEWQNSYWHKDESINQDNILGLQETLKTKLNAPDPNLLSGFYFIVQNSPWTTYQRINLNSYYLTSWNGSNFVSSNIYYNNGKLGVGTQMPTEVLQVEGNIKASGLIASGLPLANQSFIRNIVAKDDGTIGWENKSIVTDDLRRLSYISELTYTQDANNYYLKGTAYLCMKDGSGGNAGIGSNLKVFVNNNLVAGTTADRDSWQTNTFTYTTQEGTFMVAQMILPFTITIPKSTHTESYWTTGNAYATVVSTHNPFDNNKPTIIQKGIKLSF